MAYFRAFAIAALVVATVLHASVAEPLCNSSGRREECSRQAVYPCQWTASSCEFQYGEMTFTCADVPASASVSVTCTPSDVEKVYAVSILDAENYRKYWYRKPVYECANSGCRQWTSGQFTWSGESSARYNDEGGTAVESYTGGPSEYSVVVSMLDHNTCLDITCDVVFSEL